MLGRTPTDEPIQRRIQFDVPPVEEFEQNRRDAEEAVENAAEQMENAIAELGSFNTEQNEVFKSLNEVLEELDGELGANGDIIDSWSIHGENLNAKFKLLFRRLTGVIRDLENQMEDHRRKGENE